MSWRQFHVGVREPGYIAISCSAEGCGIWDQFPEAASKAPEGADGPQHDGGSVDLEYLTAWAEDHRSRYHPPERMS